jgi:hypothetical protein
LSRLIAVLRFPRSMAQRHHKKPRRAARCGVGRLGFLLALGGVVLFGQGCFSPSEEALTRLEETKKSGEELDTAMAGLEERFLGNQHTVQLWGEMARRHGQVSEVACKNHSEHYAAMALKMEQQAEKARSLRKRRSVAQVSLTRTSSHN